MSLVGFVGSRSLSPEAAPLVSSLVGGLAASGRRLSVGCCIGLDELVLRSIPGAAPDAEVAFFGIGGPGPGGSWPGFWWGSVPTGMLGAVASWAGCVPSWWAGGVCQCPDVSPAGGCACLRRRLLTRSLTLVRAVAAAGDGRGLVAVLSSPASRGTLRACAAAAARDVPVVAFTVGFAPSALPPIGVGAWSAGSGPSASEWDGFPGVARCRWRRDAAPAAPPPAAAPPAETEEERLLRWRSLRIERARCEGPMYQWQILHHADRNAPETWHCTNPASGRSYEVTAGTCTCPDWIYRGARSETPCKHMFALALHLDAQRRSSRVAA
jgi:hypothetical protein